MLLTAVAIAPLLLYIATVVERRLGPSAGGWTTALPFGFAVALFAVDRAAGAQAAGELAAGAAQYVPAQVAFGALAGLALMRWGVAAGALAGAASYVAACLVLAPLSQVVAAAVAVVALAAAAILLPAPRTRSTRERPGWMTALVCASAALVVLGGALTSLAAGPAIGGAVTAFPTISTTLAIAVLARGDRRHGAAVLVGLLRSLPAYLTFALTAAAAMPRLGLPALGVAALAATLVATITWRLMAFAAGGPAATRGLRAALARLARPVAEAGRAPAIRPGV